MGNFISNTFLNYGRRVTYSSF